MCGVSSIRTKALFKAWNHPIMPTSMTTKLFQIFAGILAICGAVSCSGPISASASDEGKTVKKQVATKSQTPDLSKKEPIKTLKGIASWYSVKTNGGKETASGRPLANEARTAAHKTLPFGSLVRVTSLFNGKSEIVRITDRGPYAKGRVIDVTVGCAKRLGFFKRGITKVKVDVLSKGAWKYRES